jgi:GNAT superfamily N-acetyltransferase
MKWSYGVTTVPGRFWDLLPRTLKSLAEGGFPDPRLFVDGISAQDMALESNGLQERYEVTTRNPVLRTFGNWVLAAWELLVRHPEADRYAIFQDDLVTYKNLRTYLEGVDIPEKGYWNLYTFPHNLKKNKSGWYPSDQMGKGAVALVFSNEGLRTLLQQQHMVDRPLDASRGWRAVDGGIVESMRKAEWTEYVHNPSLVQHTGHQSSMGNLRHAQANSFRGEDFDATCLLPSIVHVPDDESNLDRYMGWTMHKIILETDKDYVLWRESSGGTLEIFDLLVGSERRKGRGKRLVEMVLEEALRRGAKLVFAVTRPSNQISQEFYQGVGFRTVGVLKQFYRDSNPPEDAIVYGIDL